MKARKNISNGNWNDQKFGFTNITINNQLSCAERFKCSIDNITDIFGSCHNDQQHLTSFTIIFEHNFPQNPLLQNHISNFAELCKLCYLIWNLQSKPFSSKAHSNGNSKTLIIFSIFKFWILQIFLRQKWTSNKDTNNKAKGENEANKKNKTYITK